MSKVFPSTRSKVIVAPTQLRPFGDPYRPVDCDFTDDLELASVYRWILEITHWAEDNSAQKVTGVIANLVTESNKQEFLVFADGRRIRFDRIHQIRILD